MLMLLVRVSLVLSLLIGLAGCGNESRSGGDPNRTADPAPRGQSLASENCPQAAYRPSFLPWLEPGEEVPAPEESYPEHEDSSGNSVPASTHLMWIPPDGFVPEGKGPYNVVLVREDELQGGPGEPTGIAIEGVEGLLYTSVHPGEAAILWDLDQEPCNLISLRIQASEVLTRSQAEKEILRIADSLEKS